MCTLRSKLSVKVISLSPQEAAGLLTAPQQLPVPNPKRASQEESILLQNGGGRPKTDSEQAPRPRQDSTGQTTFSSGSSRAKNLIEQQRGTSRYSSTLSCTKCTVACVHCVHNVRSLVYTVRLHVGSLVYSARLHVGSCVQYVLSKTVSSV